MWVNKENPRISWISVRKAGGEEWVRYTKTFRVEEPLRSAVARFETDCVCALYVNGEFAACGNGRMPERVNAHEITTLLRLGENTLELVLGTAYFQQRGFEIQEERGFWLNSAAFELCTEAWSGKKRILATDPSWESFSDGQPQKTIETATVTDAEYAMMWANAAIWPEPMLHRPEIPEAVIQVAGAEYPAYTTGTLPEFVRPVSLLSTNMRQTPEALVPDPELPEAPFAVYDFGRLHVGFTELCCEAPEDTEVTFLHDQSEDPADFDREPLPDRVEMLRVVLPVKAGEQKIFNLRRRAYRYLKLCFPRGAKVKVTGLRLRVWMFPQVKTGWFHCPDPVLNEAWEVGKYTLQVNKHQEYESCPRYEMQFFSGDGAVDAWIDEYAFGSQELMNASLSVKHEESSTGVLFTDKWNRNAIQWDYFAWRILCIHLHYKATGDRDFLERYYEEARTDLLWQLERRNSKGLIFQRPCFVSTFGFRLGQTEWTCSAARIGEKTSLNSLLYASLTAMAELARDMGQEENAVQWLETAREVKQAINLHLWSEEKRSYTDSLDDFIAQDANTFAILFGVADRERTEAALQTMKEALWSPYGSAILDRSVPHTRGGIDTVSPFMTSLEAKARFENGRPEEGLELIRRCWGTMLKKGARTFWEFAPNNGTDRWDTPSHAWSGGCTWLLSAYILGIRSAGPNYSAMTFAPRPCDLDSFRGVVPTPAGFIAAACETVTEDGKTFRRFTLAVPQGMEVRPDLPENSTLELRVYSC